MRAGLLILLVAGNYRLMKFSGCGTPKSINRSRDTVLLNRYRSPVAGAAAYQEKKDELSPCLSECIQPLAKMERSFAFIFNNFEKVRELGD